MALRSRKYLLTVIAVALMVCVGGGSIVADVPEYFDIRLSDEKEDYLALEQLRGDDQLSSDDLAALKDSMLAARKQLQAKVPRLNIIDSKETGGPEVVGVKSGPVQLASAGNGSRPLVARRFVTDNAALYGLSPAQAAALELDADYVNPAGNLAWVRFKQHVDGIPVFRGDLTVAMTPRNEIFRTMGQLAVGVPSDFSADSPELTAAEAAAIAAKSVEWELPAERFAVSEEAADGSRVTLGTGPFAERTEMELVYFPLGPGALELAWSMTLWGNPDAYYTLVSATDGTVLFRKNITNYESHTYHVYNSDSPNPGTPGPDDPSSSFAGPRVSRSAETVDSQVSTNDPWLDGCSPNCVTDGNNVEAGMDLSGPDGVDAPVPTSGAPSTVFNYVYDPYDTTDGTGAAPTGADYRNGAAVNLFYWTNRFHDLTYDLGFTESAFNFQDNNFGRGGTGGDRVSAEGQDSSGTNNANFSTPADGGRGRMQMFVWTFTTPNIDGDLDTDIIIHELTHGLSNRLHGNATGLGSNMSRGMGEGWSDFYAHSLLSVPADPLNGTYTTGGYATTGLMSGLNSYYYGIRRFPKAVMSHTGGGSNLPHNPLTFADIDQTQVDFSGGAFPAPVAGHLSTTADQVHAAGEVWSTALWEARGQIIGQLGAAAGNQRMLQLTTDGMKLNPVNPTFVDSRDSIIAADCAGFGGADEQQLWDGFALRGMGVDAEVITPGTGGGTARVTEDFTSLSGGVAIDSITVTSDSCSTPDREPIPGETVVVTVELSNLSCGGLTATNVSAGITGGTTAFHGSLAPGASTTIDLYYTVPEVTTCGTDLMLDLTVDSDQGSQMEVVDLRVGPNPTAITEFSNAGAISIPATGTSGPASPYPSGIAVSGITDPPADVLGVTVTLHDLNHSWMDDVDVLLTSPTGQKMIVMSDAFGNTDPVDYTFTLDDAAANPIPDSGPAVSGTYQAANYGGSDVFDAPAPTGPYLDPPLSQFGNADPNGTWNLYIDDDTGGDSGTIGGGWTLGIVTAQTPVCDACSATACVPVKDVSGQTIGSPLVVEACHVLIAGDFEVQAPGGEVSFTAGEKVGLRSGFSVASGASFTADIDPSLVP